MAQARGSALLSTKGKYLATTSDNRFDFSRQPKNTKVSNYWAQKIYSEWTKAYRKHMDELNYTEQSLLTYNRDALY